MRRARGIDFALPRSFQKKNRAALEGYTLFILARGESAWGGSSPLSGNPSVLGQIALRKQGIASPDLESFPSLAKIRLRLDLLAEIAGRLGLPRLYSDIAARY